MSNFEKLKEQYATDADAMASKSRFGYFTMLPSHTAGHTDFNDKRHARDQNGRVIIEPKNIFSGSTSKPSLQKNFFKYTPSAFHGSEYRDPGKHELQMNLEQSKSQEGKDIFRPIKLNKSLVSSSYAYMTPYDASKDKKNYRDTNGNVIVHPPNMLNSPQSKIDYSSDKAFKYKECPPAQKAKISTEEVTEPFKLGAPHKEIFNNNYKTFFDADIKKTQQKKSLQRVASHDGPFKPSCISKKKPFNRLNYKEQGNGKQKIMKAEKKENNAEPFRLCKVEHNSKPCPSVSLTKVNMLRICR